MVGTLILGDTETTGLLGPEMSDLQNQPYITEIYLVKLDWDGDSFTFVDEFETFVRPPVPIPELITKITGISDETVASAPPFAKLYPGLCDFFLGERTFVAHNAAFDTGMFWVELARLEREKQFPWPQNHVCTVECSMGIENKRLKLKRLHEIVTGAEHKSQHRARGDVEALATCTAWLLKNGHMEIR